MSITEKVLCTKSHEFLLDNGNGTFTIGLTDYAVDQLGDIVFLELPEVGTEFKKGETFATVESVKAASEIYLPISGKVIEINEAAVDAPELLNEDNYINVYTNHSNFFITSEDSVTVGENALMIASDDCVQLINTDYIIYVELCKSTILNSDKDKEENDNI